MSNGRDERREAERLRDRDPQAWESFYERVYPMLLAYAQRRLGHGENARDAVCETLARTVKTIGRMEDLGTTPEAWSFGILHHVVADAQRRLYRDRRTVDAPVMDERDPSALIELDVEHEEVRQAFARLDPSERELLELRVIAGLSSDDVGEILSMSPGAVRMAQMRALEKLQGLMREVSLHG